ncbi:MAG: PspC domain-containing protein [Eisenbergiella porci]|nr:MULTISPECIES: PspC domain-containing protein [Clostridia]MDU5292418.1 PspC domain-containing protein [Clostridium sp.]MDY2651014.1 PspC domain-containing protein [Eisenbergiella porci]MDY5525896.1 PspC domain-containing protein [Eisenbergiella porci]
MSKSTTNKMVCGVCAGIAEYFNWDPTIIRIIWIAASIFLGAGFLGLIAYFIVAVIMPEG